MLGKGVALAFLFFIVPPVPLMGDTSFGELLFPARAKERRLIHSVVSSPNQVMPGETVFFTLKGNIKPGTHIYSIQQAGTSSPVPTSMRILSDWMEQKGSEESPPQTVFDQVYQRVLKVHKNQFYIRQEYKIFPFAKPGKHYMKGELTYQTCDNRICSLPKKESFDFMFEVAPYIP